MAASVAARLPSLGALTLISGGARHETATRLPAVPKLVIAGSLDNMATGDSLHRAVAAMPKPVELVLVPGVDHFWMEGEDELGRRVGTFFATALAQPTAPA